MCDQTEVSYLPGEVVWVKLSKVWWPAEVQDESKLDEDVTGGLRKKPLAVVKFFNEDTYEFPKNLDQIYRYNCLRKDEFIKKGLDLRRRAAGSKDLNRSIPSSIDKFAADIVLAEQKTNGDPKYIDDPKFAAPEENRSESPDESPSKKIKLNKDADAKQPKNPPRKSFRISANSSKVKITETKSPLSKSRVRVTKRSISKKKNKIIPRTTKISFACPYCDVSKYVIRSFFHHIDGHLSGLIPGKIPVIPKGRANEYNKNASHIFQGTAEAIAGPSLESNEKVGKKRKSDVPSSPKKKKKLADFPGKEKPSVSNKADKETAPVAPLKKRRKKKSEDAKDCSDTQASILADWDDFSEVEEKPKDSSCFDFNEDEDVINVEKPLKFGLKLPRVTNDKPPCSKPLTETALRSDDELQKEVDSFLETTDAPPLPQIPSVLDSGENNSSSLSKNHSGPKIVGNRSDDSSKKKKSEADIRPSASDSAPFGDQTPQDKPLTKSSKKLQSLPRRRSSRFHSNEHEHSTENDKQTEHNDSTLESSGPSPVKKSQQGPISGSQDNDLGTENQLKGSTSLNLTSDKSDPRKGTSGNDSGHFLELDSLKMKPPETKSKAKRASDNVGLRTESESVDNADTINSPKSKRPFQKRSTSIEVFKDGEKAVKNESRSKESVVKTDIVDVKDKVEKKQKSGSRKSTRHDRTSQSTLKTDHPNLALTENLTSMSGSGSQLPTSGKSEETAINSEHRSEESPVTKKCSVEKSDTIVVKDEVEKEQKSETRKSGRHDRTSQSTLKPENLNLAQTQNDTGMLVAGSQLPASDKSEETAINSDHRSGESPVTEKCSVEKSDKVVLKDKVEKEHKSGSRKSARHDRSGQSTLKTENFHQAQTQNDTGMLVAGSQLPASDKSEETAINSDHRSGESPVTEKCSVEKSDKVVLKDKVEKEHKSGSRKSSRHDRSGQSTLKTKNLHQAQTQNYTGMLVAGSQLPASDKSEETAINSDHRIGESPVTEKCSVEKSDTVVVKDKVEKEHKSGSRKSSRHDRSGQSTLKTEHLNLAPNEDHTGMLVAASQLPASDKSEGTAINSDHRIGESPVTEKCSVEKSDTVVVKDKVEKEHKSGSRKSARHDRIGQSTVKAEQPILPQEENSTCIIGAGPISPASGNLREVEVKNISSVIASLQSPRSEDVSDKSVFGAQKKSIRTEELESGTYAPSAGKFEIKSEFGRNSLSPNGKSSMDDVVNLIEKSESTSPPQSGLDPSVSLISSKKSTKDQLESRIAESEPEKSGLLEHTNEKTRERRKSPRNRQSSLSAVETTTEISESSDIKSSQSDSRSQKVPSEPTKDEIKLLSSVSSQEFSCKIESTTEKLTSTHSFEKGKTSHISKEETVDVLKPIKDEEQLKNNVDKQKRILESDKEATRNSSKRVKLISEQGNAAAPDANQSTGSPSKSQTDSAAKILSRVVDKYESKNVIDKHKICLNETISSVSSKDEIPPIDSRNSKSPLIDADKFSLGSEIPTFYQFKDSELGMKEKNLTDHETRTSPLKQETQSPKKKEASPLQKNETSSTREKESLSPQRKETPSLQKNETSSPLQKETSSFQKDETISPLKQVTPSTHKKGTSSPQKKRTSSPQKKESSSPQKKETSSPQKKETSSPQKKETPSAQKKETLSDKKKETSSPQKKEIPLAQKKETPSPQKKQTSSPQKNETLAPQKAETPSTQQNVTLSPQKIEIPSLQNKEPSSSQKKEPSSPKKKETPSVQKKESPSPRKREMTVPQREETSSPHKKETPSAQKKVIVSPQKIDLSSPQKRGTPSPQEEETSSQKKETPSAQKIKTSSLQNKETSSHQMKETPSAQKKDISSPPKRGTLSPQEEELSSSQKKEIKTPSPQNKETSSQKKETPSTQKKDVSSHQKNETSSAQKIETSLPKKIEVPAAQKNETPSAPKKDTSSHQWVETFSSQKKEAPSAQGIKTPSSKVIETLLPLEEETSSPQKKEKPSHTNVQNICSASPKKIETFSLQERETTVAQKHEKPSSPEKDTPSPQGVETSSPRKNEAPSTQKIKTPSSLNKEASSPQKKETPSALRNEILTPSKKETLSAPKKDTPSPQGVETSSPPKNEAPSTQKIKTPLSLNKEASSPQKKETPSALRNEIFTPSKKETLSAPMKDTPSPQGVETSSPPKNEAPSSQKIKTPSTQNKEASSPQKNETPSALRNENLTPSKKETPSAQKKESLSNLSSKSESVKEEKRKSEVDLKNDRRQKHDYPPKTKESEKQNKADRTTSRSDDRKYEKRHSDRHDKKKDSRRRSSDRDERRSESRSSSSSRRRDYREERHRSDRHRREESRHSSRSDERRRSEKSDYRERHKESDRAKRHAPSSKERASSSTEQSLVSSPSSSDSTKVNQHASTLSKVAFLEESSAVQVSSVTPQHLSQGVSSLQGEHETVVEYSSDRISASKIDGLCHLSTPFGEPSAHLKFKSPEPFSNRGNLKSAPDVSVTDVCVTMETSQSSIHVDISKSQKQNEKSAITESASVTGVLKEEPLPGQAGSQEKTSALLQNNYHAKDPMVCNKETDADKLNNKISDLPQTPDEVISTQIVSSHQLPAISTFSQTSDGKASFQSDLASIQTEISNQNLVPNLEPVEPHVNLEVNTGLSSNNNILMTDPLDFGEQCFLPVTSEVTVYTDTSVDAPGRRLSATDPQVLSEPPLETALVASEVQVSSCVEPSLASASLAPEDVASSKISSPPNDMGLSEEMDFNNLTLIQDICVGNHFDDIPGAKVIEVFVQRIGEPVPEKFKQAEKFIIKHDPVLENPKLPPFPHYKEEEKKVESSKLKANSSVSAARISVTSQSNGKVKSQSASLHTSMKTDQVPPLMLKQGIQNTQKQLVMIPGKTSAANTVVTSTSFKNLKIVNKSVPITLSGKLSKNSAGQIIITSSPGMSKSVLLKPGQVSKAKSASTSLESGQTRQIKPQNVTKSSIVIQTTSGLQNTSSTTQLQPEKKTANLPSKPHKTPNILQKSVSTGRTQSPKKDVGNQVFAKAKKSLNQAAGTSAQPALAPSPREVLIVTLDKYGKYVSAKPPPLVRQSTVPQRETPSVPTGGGRGGAKVRVQKTGPHQDILAEALANTMVLQSDLADSEVPPPPSLSSSVLETSLTLGQPIMTPLEVPSSIPVIDGQTFYISNASGFQILNTDSIVIPNEVASALPSKELKARESSSDKDENVLPEFLKGDFSKKSQKTSKLSDR